MFVFKGRRKETQHCHTQTMCSPKNCTTWLKYFTQQACSISNSDKCSSHDTSSMFPSPGYHTKQRTTCFPHSHWQCMKALACMHACSHVRK